MSSHSSVSLSSSICLSSLPSVLLSLIFHFLPFQFTISPNPLQSCNETLALACTSRSIRRAFYTPFSWLYSSLYTEFTVSEVSKFRYFSLIRTLTIHRIPPFFPSNPNFPLFSSYFPCLKHLVLNYVSFHHQLWIFDLARRQNSASRLQSLALLFSPLSMEHIQQFSGLNRLYLFQINDPDYPSAALLSSLPGLRFLRLASLSEAAINRLQNIECIEEIEYCGANWADILQLQRLNGLKKLSITNCAVNWCVGPSEIDANQTNRTEAKTDESSHQQSISIQPAPLLRFHGLVELRLRVSCQSLYFLRCPSIKCQMPALPPINQLRRLHIECLDQRVDWRDLQSFLRHNIHLAALAFSHLGYLHSVVNWSGLGLLIERMDKLEDIELSSGLIKALQHVGDGRIARALRDCLNDSGRFRDRKSRLALLRELKMETCESNADREMDEN